jgi:DNA-binding NtrC family response regulator
MDLPSDSKPEFESLQQLLLDMALERCVDGLLRLIVRRLVARPHIELQAYNWPGNVRELQNVIERAVILAQSSVLRFDLQPATDSASRSFIEKLADQSSLQGRILTETEMQAMVRKNTRKALEHCHGKVNGPDGAAALLGLKPTTLIARIKKMGLPKFG